MQAELKAEIQRLVQFIGFANLFSPLKLGMVKLCKCCDLDRNREEYKLGHEVCVVVLLRRMLAERYILFFAISFRVVRSLNVQALPSPSRSFYPVLKRDRIAKEPFISGAKMTTVLSAVKIN